jgi:hypothetical protein
MSPTARKVARLSGELQSLHTRLRNLIPDLQKLDSESRALATASDTTRKGQHDAYAATLEYITDKWKGMNVVPWNHLEWWLKRMMKETDPTQWEKDNEVHAVHDPVTGTTEIE